MHVLTLNAGSSSIKFAIYKQTPALQRLLHGQVERIGTADAAIEAHRLRSTVGAERPPEMQPELQTERYALPSGGFETAAAALVSWLQAQP